MKRVRIKDALLLDINQEIMVSAWVRAFRANRFIALNDGSCLNNMQVVVDFENFPEDVIKNISIGSAISVIGNLVESEGKGQKVEIQANKIKIIGKANPDDIQKTIIQPKRHSLERLREQAHLRFRTNLFGAIFRIRHNMAYAIHKYFNDKGFYYLHTPIITGSDAEEQEKCLK